MTGEELLRLVVRAQILLWDGVDAALREAHDLALGHYLPMRVIADTSDCRVQEIAEQLAITTSGASQAVDRLEKAGRVRRRPNPADRRSSVIELTDTGQVLVEAAAITLDQQMRRQLDRLPADTTHQLGRHLTDLLAAHQDR